MAPVLKYTLHNTTQHNTDRNCCAQLPRTCLHRNLIFYMGWNYLSAQRGIWFLLSGIYSDLIHCSTVLNFFLAFFGSCTGIWLDFNSHFLTKLASYNPPVSLYTEVKRQQIWNYKPWRGACRRVVRWKSTDVSEEHVASVFRVEEQSERDTSVKAGGKQDMSLRNVSWLLTDYMLLYPKT
jgi:hypothetical protein